MKALMPTETRRYVALSFGGSYSALKLRDLTVSDSDVGHVMNTTLFV